MKNWTDKVINWHQLPGTEVKRLIDTWGMTERQLANYDAKHGYVHTPLAQDKSATKTEATTPAKAVKKATTVAPKKAPVRQKHTGADGEIKFVEHRNLFVGFFGGKVVVTKRTAEACKEVLRKEFNIEV